MVSFPELLRIIQLLPTHPSLFALNPSLKSDGMQDFTIKICQKNMKNQQAQIC